MEDIRGNNLKPYVFFKETKLCDIPTHVFWAEWRKPNEIPNPSPSNFLPSHNDAINSNIYTSFTQRQ